MNPAMIAKFITEDIGFHNGLIVEVNTTNYKGHTFKVSDPTTTGERLLINTTGEVVAAIDPEGKVTERIPITAKETAVQKPKTVKTPAASTPNVPVAPPTVREIPVTGYWLRYESFDGEVKKKELWAANLLSDLKEYTNALREGGYKVNIESFKGPATTFKDQTVIEY